MAPLLTLTTDFGTRDAYVAAMKGVILGICPHARLVDVTHEIAPQDIMETAFVLREAAPYFPEGTVHLTVVDPGVGTARRAVAVAAGGHHYVGPDNGVFSLLLDGRAPDRIVELNDSSAWRTDRPSTTFHGRDIFAPAAAHLAAGRPIEALGSPVEALAPMHWVLPITDDQGVRGWVAHIDHFGNCITNIPGDLLDGRRDLRCYVGSTTLCGLHRTYGAVDPGEPLLLVGSSGYLEVAVRGADAAELLGIRKGAAVNVVFQPS